jgi:hypothetical protein
MSTTKQLGLKKEEISLIKSALQILTMTVLFIMLSACDKTKKMVQDFGKKSDKCHKKNTIKI